MRFHELQDDGVQGKLHRFVGYALAELGIDRSPEIIYINDKHHAANLGSFGGFSLEDKAIRVNIAGRHPVDIMRTLAHELVHYRQDREKQGGLTADDGATGTDYENEANAVAGRLMRGYARSNPSIFESRR